MNNISDMKTIPKTAAKYREYGISERAIRRWVKEEIPFFIRVGVKVLIHQGKFELFLRGELT